MQFERIEENYQPRPGQMDTRALWLVYTDDVAGYANQDDRKGRSTVVLDEQERRVLRLAMGLDGEGGPVKPGRADLECASQLLRAGLLRAGSLRGEYSIALNGPLAYDDLRALLTLGED